MSKTPFSLISWHDNFLEGVLETISRDKGKTTDLSNVICLFPHTRPQRYMSAMLRKDNRFSKPLLMPVCYTVSGLFNHLHTSISPSRTLASQLDLVGLMLSLFRSEPSLHSLLDASNSPFDEGEVYQKKNAFEPHHFFPWGLRLTNLFEECFIQRKEPKNFAYVQDKVTPFATKLLENIGQLFSLYTNALDKNNWTTSGYDAFSTVRYLEKNQGLPTHLFEGKQILLCGFFGLSGAEDALFHHLWEQYGMQILLHGDPRLVANTARGEQKPHWSCRPLKNWASRWGTSLEFCKLPSSKHTSTSFRYVEGYDLHTQLHALQTEFQDKETHGINSYSTKNPNSNKENASLNVPQEIAEFPGKIPDDDQDEVLTAFSADTAIILPGNNLLMPTLHHLPHTDINISMGYPLARSPLFRLLDTIFRLQESHRISGYYWKDLIELARHPYLKMLALLNNESESQQAEETLRRELHRFEQALREYNRTFAKPEEVLQVLYSLMPEEDLPTRSIMELLLRVFTVTLKGFEGITTTAKLAQAMNALCHVLLENGMPLWKRFPIDAECLYRFTQSVIPELARSAMANEELSSDTVFLIARQLLQIERVPFDAAPLVGIQVMGMLETRLLNFKRVFILDATDDNLPGVSSHDPLLPESLRPELGLPDLKQREDVAAYHFFRLLAGTTEAVMYWQESTDAPGIQEGKQKRSRFIEELLWNEEKQRGKTLSHKGIDGPLTTLSTSVAPISMERCAVRVTSKIRDLIINILSRPVSASLLDSYIRCPVRFFHERLLQLSPVSEISEDSDPLKVGTLLHKALQEFYEPLVNKKLPEGKDLIHGSFSSLQSILHLQPEYLELSRTIPADSFAMLAQASDLHLQRYLAEQPSTTVLALEHELSGGCEVLGKIIPLTGKADRIDKRNDALIILDYKTGKLPNSTGSLWDNDMFWKQIEECTPNTYGDVEKDPLCFLSKNMLSIQLPFYLHLLYNMRQRNIFSSFASLNASTLNAGWLALGTDGKEYPLFHDGIGRKNREEAIVTRIPSLVKFIISHMATTSWLYPFHGSHCTWCQASKACCKG